MKLTMEEMWTPRSWYCSNCGNKVTAFMNGSGSFKVECSRCRVVMVRTSRSRRHDTINIYAPDGQEHTIEVQNFMERQVSLGNY